MHRAIRPIVAIAIAAVSACSTADGGSTPLLEGEDVAPAATDAPIVSTTTTSASIATSGEPPDASESMRSTECRDDAVPSTADAARSAPAPVEPTAEEPGFVVAVREPRMVDGPHLISDLERRLGSVAPILLPAGEHETGALGGSSTLSLAEPWRLFRADPGLLVFGGAEETLQEGRPLLLVGRPAGLPDPASATSSVDAPLDPAASAPVPRDLRTWFDSIDAVVVVGCSDATLFGADATVYDVMVDPDAGDTSFCVPVGRCVTAFEWHTGGPAFSTTVHLNDRSLYRVWHVHDEDNPLVAVAIAPSDEFDGWAARAARLLVESDIEVTAPLPLPDHAFGRGIGIVPAGSTNPLSLTSVTVELDEPAWAANFARSFLLGPLDAPPPWQDGPTVEIFVVDTDARGPINSVQEAVDALERNGQVTPLPEETIFGRPATVMTASAAEPVRVFRTTTAPPGTAVEAEGFGWFWLDEREHSLWIVDVGDHLLAVAAYAGMDDDPDVAIEFARKVLTTARLTDG